MDEYVVVSEGPAEVEPTEDGPVLVRNARAVADADGRSHPVERPLVALCGCGFSQRKPWCDSTHKVART